VKPGALSTPLPVSPSAAGSTSKVETQPKADTENLDTLLAGLGKSDPPVEVTKPAPADADELDALLASLNAKPPPPGPTETESELDALLASLK
jgi:hypothetical protein